MAFLFTFAWLAVAAAQPAPSEECESGACEESTLLQLRSGQFEGSQSTSAAATADVWLTKIGSNAQPTQILAQQSPLSFQSASLLSYAKRPRKPHAPGKPRPSLLQPSSLHCDKLNGTASRACEVVHTNVSLQKSAPATVQQCCAWVGAQCPGEPWCDEKQSQCEGACTGNWVTHCCSFDGVSCPATNPDCDASAQGCSGCGGQWYELPLEAAPAPTPPPTLPPGPPCCSWDGTTCKGHDAWCDAKKSQCLQCSGQWLVPTLAWKPVNGGTNQACRGDHSGDNSDSYYKVETASNEEDCKGRCIDMLSTGCCNAIEYNPSDGRCELWIKTVKASSPVNGYNCWRLDPRQNCPVPDGVTRVTVNPFTTYQTMRGFGAAMTQSSAHLLQNLKLRNQGLYNEVMNRLFGTGPDTAGISIVRFPIGSCDFSLRAVTYNDAWNDWDLSHFSLDADTEKIVATLLDAKAINGGLLLMGSPWSPPAWLKVQGTLEGNNNANTLKSGERIYNTYADYFLKVKQTFAARGLPLDYLTLQNEPLYAPDYPGMYLVSGDYARLGAKIKSRVGSTPKLLAYDHNWNQPEYPQQVINAVPSFDGTAFHCYGGSMAEAQTQLHNAFPNKEILMTECTGSYPNNKCDINKGFDSFGYNHEWDMNNLFLNNNLNWGSAGIKWNVVLDESCGPILPGVSYQWGRPLVSIPSWASNIDQIKFNQDFWTVAHMGRFVRPGAKRVEVTETTPGGSSLIGAFKDDSAGTITLMAVNKDHGRAMELEVTYANQVLTYSVPAWGTAVFVWPTNTS